MRRKMLIALGGLALGLAGLGVWVSPNLAEALGRYPGSVLIGQEHLQFNSVGHSSIARQANYRTTDALLTVRGWYATRYQIDPDSEKNFNLTGECIWLRQAKRALRLEHTIVVTLCAMPYGTRISVNESVYLYP